MQDHHHQCRADARGGGGTEDHHGKDPLFRLGALADDDVLTGLSAMFGPVAYNDLLVGMGRNAKALPPSLAALVLTMVLLGCSSY